MNKKFYICIIFVIVVIGTIIFINSKSKEKLDYEVHKLGNSNYFLLYENNKYGVIDRSGKKIIEPTYDVVEIPNPEQDFFICKNNYNMSTKEYNVHVFNSKGDTILYQFYIVEAIKLNGVENNGFYEKSVLKYKSEGKYGLADFSGKKITEPKYDAIDGFEYNEGLLVVQKSGKYGIINMNGKKIIDSKFDEIHSDGYYGEHEEYKNNGYIVGVKSDEGMRYGYIDKNGKQLLKNEYNDIYGIVGSRENGKNYLIASKNGKTGVYEGKRNIINHEYDDITYNDENNLFIVQKKSKFGVIKFDGTQVIPISYDNIFFAGAYINAQNADDVDIFDTNGNKEPSSNYISKHSYCDNKYEIVSTSDGEYKLINSENNTIIAEQYLYMQYLFKNYFIAKKNDHFGIIDNLGKVVIDFKYTEIQPISNYKIAELISENKEITIINENLEEVAPRNKYSVLERNEYLKLSRSEDAIFIDKNGNKEDNISAFPDNKLFAFSQKGKWGYKNRDGEIIIKSTYQFASEFNEFGFAAVKSDGMWGSIDENGNLVKAPSYKFEKEPSFIGEYYIVELGYGEPYCTK